MLTVSLLVEIIRTRPRLVFWLATLIQAALWTLVPSFFYTAPPGNVAEVLAIGHQFKLGTDLGPPLAYWLAEIVFRAARGHLAGIYLLSQICVIVTYWAVFRLGSAIVGERHAALAVMLMTGISALTVPTPDFGPAVLAMPFWALTLLFYWRAVGQNRPPYWFGVALCLGLLLLTTYVGLVLLVLLALFTALMPAGRASMNRIEPWIAATILVMMLFPHLIWIDEAPDFNAFRSVIAGNAEKTLGLWPQLLGAIVAAHIGLFIIAALASNFFRPTQGTAPAIERIPVSPFARRYVYVFAIVPVLVVVLLSSLTGMTTPAMISPLVVLSGLAAIVAAGDTIRLHHQHLASLAWVALLITPPTLTAAAVVFLPWTIGVDLKIGQPADEIGRFFTDSFERRTGKPFTIVGGDPYLASLVALASSRRPSVYRETGVRRTAWVGRDVLTSQGAVLVWPANDMQGTPPPEIREKFPDLVPEIPRAFERRVQGRLPLLRIGWGVVRPQEQPAATGSAP
ncbi:MAG: glycosyltransferase family 39 protein [Pseudorhodoplanes sp.]